MQDVRGLTPKTRDTALRIVGRLLSACFGDGPVGIVAIRPEHVRRFFEQQAKLYSKSASAGSVVASLRGYFRYRASLGDLVHALVGAVFYLRNPGGGPSRRAATSRSGRMKPAQWSVDITLSHYQAPLTCSSRRTCSRRGLSPGKHR